MILSVSPSGRPALTPRTMMSSALGKMSTNLLMRRMRSRDSTRLGRPSAAITPTSPASGRLPDLMKTAERDHDGDPRRDHQELPLVDRQAGLRDAGGEVGAFAFRLLLEVLEAVGDLLLVGGAIGDGGVGLLVRLLHRGASHVGARSAAGEDERQPAEGEDRQARRKNRVVDHRSALDSNATAPRRISDSSSAAASRCSSPKYRARSQKRGRPTPVERCRPRSLPCASSPRMS